MTGAQIQCGLAEMGVRTGELVMVHASLSAIGWVVGGAETVVRALLATVGPHGTICAQTTWEDIPFHLAEWPQPWKDAYLDGLPPFDPRLSEAAHFEGRFAERLRTWPGARRSGNPGNCVSAVGKRARWLTARHPLDDGFGAGSPYARLVAGDAQVVLLGAPLHAISLLHHAECLADTPDKLRTQYRVPLLVRGRARWTTITQLDVWRGPFRYADVVPDGQAPFTHIARAALGAGVGVPGRIGAATAYRFGARELVQFAVGWLEDRFGGGS